MISDKTAYIASTTGFAMIAAAMAVPLVAGPLYTGTWYHYLYAAGAAIMVVCALLSPYRGKDMKMKALRRMQSWSSLMFVAAAVLLFWPGSTMRDWIAFTLAGAVLRGYSTIAISNRLRKQADKH